MTGRAKGQSKVSAKSPSGVKPAGSMFHSRSFAPQTRRAESQEAAGAGPLDAYLEVNSGVEPLQREVADEANRTGMPDRLKAGLEGISGMDLSDVRVHYNSPKPAELQALAYAQGTDIHVGPGQEHHLPHEGWHAVQQLQGRVRPTMKAHGVAINDDAGLEKEADVMGAKAVQRQEKEKKGKKGKKGKK